MAVGIAMVNYNGSDVLALTLDSLTRAHTKTPYTVCLVDNASDEPDYLAAKACFDKFAARKGASGKDKLIRAEKNLGFAGGSNLSAEELLRNETIDRICYLNTDVIVTDGWLDLLMESELDIVGPVTNANGNEQTIWIDYEANRDLTDYDKVAEFAAFRAKTYAGYEVSSECVTGFCSLIKRDLIDKIGLFDLRFYPGGFDDNDYDRRAMAVGGKVGIRRDCFIHHYGGGSFSKLKANNRVGVSYANMKRYEDKWHTVWTGAQQLLPDSLYQDMTFLMTHPTDDKRALGLMTMTKDALKGLLRDYESKVIEDNKRLFAQDTLRQLRHPNEDEASADKTPIPFYPDPNGYDITQRMIHTTGGLVRNCVGGVKAVLRGGRLMYHVVRAPGRRNSAYAKAINFIHAAKTTCKGVVAIRTPIYRPENMADGYYQRVYAVDQYVLKDYAKLYFEHEPLQEYATIEAIDDRHMVVHCNLCDDNNINAIEMLFRMCGTVYSHSLLRCVWDELHPRLLQWLTKDYVRFVVDMHGAVPEEAALYDNWIGAQICNTHEEIVMSGANIIIAVNHAMLDHFRKKYDYMNIKPTPVVMPIYLDKPVEQSVIDDKLKHSDYTRPLAVYAGGLQAWQNIPLMQDVIEKAGNRYRYDMLVSEPEAFEKLYGTRRRPNDMKVHRGTPEEVAESYRDCHYGFVLRDDIAVNNVACPTKLIEYIRFGVLPVMKTEHIGDFARYGMRYVSYEDFRDGNIPDAAAFEFMIRHNLEVLSAFTKDYQQGREELTKLLAGKESAHE